MGLSVLGLGAGSGWVWVHLDEAAAISVQRGGWLRVPGRPGARGDQGAGLSLLPLYCIKWRAVCCTARVTTQGSSCPASRSLTCAQDPAKRQNLPVGPAPACNRCLLPSCAACTRSSPAVPRPARNFSFHTRHVRALRGIAACKHRPRDSVGLSCNSPAPWPFLAKLFPNVLSSTHSCLASTRTAHSPGTQVMRGQHVDAFTCAPAAAICILHRYMVLRS